MVAQDLKRELQAGRIDLDRLLELLGSQQQQLNAANDQLAKAHNKIAELEAKIAKLESKQPKLAEPFSVQSEEKRQAARGKKKFKKAKPARRGRIATAEKIKLCTRTEKVFPAGIAESDCYLSHTRPVWRFIDGRAVRVAYQIYRGPKNQYGKIPGVLGRCEFGWEIMIAIAFLVYIVGLSFDKVCMLLGFFQNLPIKKSQAEAIIKRLAKHWEGEFDILCTLLAHASVVHADETSWSIKSVWVFLSEHSRVMLYGVNKDAATLAKLLDPAVFAGIMISDDAAVYANFTHAQKCWAHLLRKAIKLTLLEPKNETYREFTDELLEIYRAACRLQSDKRYSDEGRAAKIVELDDRIVDLCFGMCAAGLPKQEGPLDDYRLLCNELMRLMLANELFTFVTAPPVTKPNGETQAVAGTNNEAERTLRNPSGARDTGRENKEPPGTKRQSVTMTVLESLRCYLSEFTLQKVIDETQPWLDTGQSCFLKWLIKLGLAVPEESYLAKIFPEPTPQ